MIVPHRVRGALLAFAVLLTLASTGASASMSTPARAAETGTCATDAFAERASSQHLSRRGNWHRIEYGWDLLAGTCTDGLPVDIKFSIAMKLQFTKPKRELGQQIGRVIGTMVLTLPKTQPPPFRIGVVVHQPSRVDGNVVGEYACADGTCEIRAHATTVDGERLVSSIRGTLTARNSQYKDFTATTLEFVGVKWHNLDPVEPLPIAISH